MLNKLITTIIIGVIACQSTLAFASLSEESTTVSTLKLGQKLQQNYTFTSSDGQHIDLSDQHYPLLVSVFTTWCKVCKVELKEVNEIAQEKKLSKHILVINAGETPKRVEKYLKRQKLDLNTGIDSKLEFTKNNQIFGTPAIFIFDTDKKLVYQGSELPLQWHTYLQ
ncbi:MAG: TlpA disulfide reductase family protein [bacterium]|nr:TlpA disulfide reductase family protein [bacterium]